MTNINSKTGLLLINDTSFIINEGLTFIGRDPVNCSIILTNATISKQHALVIKVKDSYYISDLQSTNGTRLEEVCLTPRFCYEITNNANISIGDVNCKFTIQEYNAIFKTPVALSKKPITPTISLDTTKIVDTNIHDLPTQLNEYEETTQSTINNSTLMEDTQILESSIIETPNINLSKISRPNISNQKQSLKIKNKISFDNDDFVIPETQTENTSIRTEKQFEIDESNNSNQLEFSNLDISDTQMVEVHESYTKTPPNQSTHNTESQKDGTKKNLYEVDTQLLEPSFHYSTPKNIHNMETQYLDPANINKININEAETQLFEQETIETPKNHNIYNTITQCISKPSTSKDINNDDTQLFEQITSNSVVKNPHIHNMTTQYFDLTPNIDSPTLNIHEEKTQLFEGTMGEVNTIKDKGEPFNESTDELQETQFEFDAEPNIETPKLNQVAVDVEKKEDSKPNESENILESENGFETAKRVIGRHRPINFTQEHSQENKLTESQSEPEISAMKQLVIGNYKAINFTSTPCHSQKDIDLNETQFDEDIIDHETERRSQNTGINDINPKISPGNPHFSDSDVSLNHSIKNNIRDIILTFEAASKNSSNISTPSKSLQDSPIKFDHDRTSIPFKDVVRNKVSKSVETDLNNISTQIMLENVELQSSSVTNSLNDNISNSAVQHVYYSSNTEKSKIYEGPNPILKNAVEVFDAPTQISEICTNNLEKKDDISKKSSEISHTATMNVTSQIKDQHASTSRKKSKISKKRTSVTTTDDEIFVVATQLIESGVKASQRKTKISRKPTPTLHVDSTNDEIFDIATQVIESNSKISKKTSKKLTSKLQNDTTTDDGIFDIATQIIEPNEAVSPNNLNVSKKLAPALENTNIEIFDVTTQIIDPSAKTSQNNFKVSKEPDPTLHKDSTDDDEIFYIATQVIESSAKESKTNFDVFKKPSAMLHKESINDDDVFDIATQVIEPSIREPQKTSDVFKKPSPMLHKESINDDDDDDVFDIATQIIETPSNISNREKDIFDMQTEQLNLNPIADEQTNIDVTSQNNLDIFDMPTQVLNINNTKKISTPNISNKLNNSDIPIANASKKLEHIQVNELEIAEKTSELQTFKSTSEHTNLEEILDTENIFDIPTQKIEQLLPNVSKSIEIVESSSSENLNDIQKLISDDDLDNILKDEPQLKKDIKTQKLFENDSLASSSTEEIISARTKRNTRRSSAVEEYLSTKKSTRRTTNRGKYDRCSTVKTKDSPTSSSTSSKTTNTSSTVVSNTRDYSDKIISTVKIKDSLTSLSKTISNSSSTSFTTDSSSSITNSDRENEKKTIKKMENDNIECSTSKKQNRTSKRTNKEINGECSTSPTKITRTRKRTDVEIETDLKTKVRKLSKNNTRLKAGKESLIEENNNTKDKKEKLLNKNEEIKRQNSEEKLKLTRRKINEPSTSKAAHESPEVLVTSRSTRKSKIPLKVESPSEVKAVQSSSTRKRCHQGINTIPPTSESASPTKIMKLESGSRILKEKYKVMFTIFRDDEQEQIVKKLGGNVVEKSKEANVLVTNQIKRSVKLLNAISQAIPIVSPRWLDVCGNSKTFIDPWKYLLNDVEAEKKFKFKLKESLNISKRNGLLFEGYTAMITKSVPTDLKDILENGGAKYITSWPRNPTDKHFIVSVIEDKSQWPKQSKNKTIIVSAEAIFSSVIRQKLDLKSYTLL